MNMEFNSTTGVCDCKDNYHPTIYGCSQNPWTDTAQPMSAWQTAVEAKIDAVAAANTWQKVSTLVFWKFEMIFKY